MKRIKSGINGLDKLIEGGFPEGSVILVSGAPGTGKTLFGLQYICYGANHDEPGVYVSFEEDPAKLKLSAEKIGIDFSELEGREKVIITRIKEIKDVVEILEEIENLTNKIRAKRLVIDSLSSITLFASTFESITKEIPSWLIGKRFPMPPAKGIVRRTLYKMIDSLKSLGVTTLLTSEALDGYSREGIAEFVVDGIIRLSIDYAGEIPCNKLAIHKMRQTKVDRREKFLWFTEKGLEVKEEPQGF